MLKSHLTGEGNMFKSLSISDWRQFEQINVDFHPRLTILTGANGSGKTTILRLLGGQTGWKFEFIGRDSGKTKGLKKQLTKAFEGKADKQTRTNAPRERVGIGA